MNTSNLNRFLLFSFFTFWIGGGLLAQSEVYVNQVFGTPLVVGAKMTVEDEKYGEFQDYDKSISTEKVENRLVWSLFQDSLGSLQPGTYRMLVDVLQWDEGTVSQEEANKGNLQEMVIRVDTMDQRQPRAIYTFTGARKFSLKVRSLTYNDRSLEEGSGLKMQLVGEVIVKRSNCTTDVTASTPGSISFPTLTSESVSITAGEVALVSMMDCAEEYDLEFCFFDRDSKEGKYILSVPGADPSVGSTSVDELMRHNGTRLTLKAPELEFRMFGLYRDGVLLVRYRGAAYTPDGIRLFSPWSSQGENLNGFSDKISIDHQSDRNWQATTAFAEDAKQLPTVTYQDGTMRPRQSMTIQYGEVNGVPNPSTEYAISQRSLYDGMGRPAATLLPTPTYKAGSSEPRLEFNAGNLERVMFENTNFYDKTELEKSSVSWMSKDFGAGNYYSNANSNVSGNNHPDIRERNAFVPDARFYPLSVSRFTADNTGRIRRQGNTGTGYQPGQNDTKYFYGKPTQYELDRLFGSNVGFASHYEKRGVVDPNQQASVSYIDAKGRTVATALAGAKPSKLEAIPSYDEAVANATVVEVDILNNITASGDTLMTTHALMVLSSSDYSICHVLEQAQYCLTCPIDDPAGSDDCYDCKYDVEVKIVQTDQESGIPVVKASYTASNVTNSGDATNCMAGTPSELSDVLLDAGEYIIVKKVWVNQLAVEAAGDEYLETSACVDSEETYVETYIETVDLTGCQECDCSQRRSEMSPECRTLCLETVTPCSALRQQMLQDVSPGGQYANYTTVEDGSYAANSGQLSIFSINQGLTGSADFAYYQLVDFGLEEVTIGDVSFSPAELSITDFIAKWNPRWAEFLLEYHPEYCFLSWCTANIDTPRGNSGLSSHLFDTELQKINTWAEADELYELNSLDLIGLQGQTYDNLEVLVSTDPISVSNSWEERLMDIVTGDRGNEPANDALSIAYNFVYSIQGWRTATDAWDFDLAPTWQQDVFWRMFRDMYIGKKRILVEILQQEDCQNGVASTTAPTINHGSGWNCLQQAICNEMPCSESNCSSGNEAYANYTARVNFVTSADAFDEDYSGLTAADLQAIADEAEDLIEISCVQRCSDYTVAWKNELENCGSIAASELDNAVTVLYEICVTGCAAGLPVGSSTVPEGIPPVTFDGTDFRSFPDVLSHYMTGTSTCDAAAACTPYLINFPPPADRDAYYGALTLTQSTIPLWLTSNYAFLQFQIDALREDCACNSCPDTPPSSSPAAFPQSLIDGIAYFNQLDPVDVAITLDAIADFVDNYTPGGIGNIPQSVLDLTSMIIPAEFNSAGKYCVYRDKYDELLSELSSDCGTPTANLDPQLVTNFLNASLGWDRSVEEYAEFEATGLFGGNCMICADPLQPGLPNSTETVSCEEQLLAEATTDAQHSYAIYLDLELEAFQQRYKEFCLSAASEELKMEYTPLEYHYTLYYYDQAGNLSMTVPPEGVTPLDDPADIFDAEDWRKGLTDSQHSSETDGNPNNDWAGPLPEHRMPTHYAHNSFNGVELSDNPDSDLTRSWYDRFGRIALTRDGRQRDLNAYSYTQHDDLGRVVEVGEFTIDGYSPENDPLYWSFENGIVDYFFQDLYDTYQLPTVKQYQTFTTYTEPSTLFGPAAAINSRNRVTKVKHINGILNAANAPYYQSHYKYDIAGNVDTLIQDFPELATIGHQYKMLDYDYDLISGNVNALYYQQGESDQFTYRYEYDKINRLSAVYTSEIETDHSNTTAWKRDAAYTYYDYGPLRRSIIGQDNLQGCDFAYTIQGWMKLMNGTNGTKKSTTTTLMDMNGDGNATAQYGGIMPTQNRDLFRYGISYHNQDYYPTALNQIISGGITKVIPTWYGTTQYNGNIAGYFRTTATDGYALSYFLGYYDQLYRLDRGVQYSYYSQDPTVIDNSNRYNNLRTFYSYDGNGNIESLQRYLYWYVNNSIKSYNNRLAYNYNDPDNSNLLGSVYSYKGGNLSSSLHPFKRVEGSQVYTYDGSGNLVENRDLNPSLQQTGTIDWTPYGRVTKVDNNRLGNNPYRNILKYGYGPDQNRWVKTGQLATTGGQVSVENKEYQVHDATGNTIATYSHGLSYNYQDDGEITTDFQSTPFTWKQQYLYGSSRLGLVNMDKALYSSECTECPNTVSTEFGARLYELADHLGNVSAIFSENIEFREEKKTVGGSLQTTLYQAPQLISFTDYLPFGLNIDRVDDPALESEYRYGFNGKEQDDNGEWGDLTHNDYGARIYNPAIARFLSIDPKVNELPHSSGYVMASNAPISRIDPDGQWDVVVHVYNDRGKYGYGILIVRDHCGNVVARYKIRAEGTNGITNNYNKRDRMKTNSDTPLGVYNLDGWITASTKGKKRMAYGPNDRLSISPNAGEILTSGRSLIRVHGGRQESETVTKVKNPDGTETTNYSYSPITNAALNCTQGCMRIADGDIAAMKSLTDQLEATGDMPFSLTVRDDLIKVGSEYFVPEQAEAFKKEQVVYDNALSDYMEQLVPAIQKGGKLPNQSRLIAAKYALDKAVKDADNIDEQL